MRLVWWKPSGPGFVAFPGLRFETWGTRPSASLALGVSFEDHERCRKQRHNDERRQSRADDASQAKAHSHQGEWEGNEEGCPDGHFYRDLVAKRRCAALPTLDNAGPGCST
jgi:hypothetical protein